jgi:hypothetical protein
LIKIEGIVDDLGYGLNKMKDDFWVLMVSLFAESQLYKDARLELIVLNSSWTEFA